MRIFQQKKMRYVTGFLSTIFTKSHLTGGVTLYIVDILLGHKNVRNRPYGFEIYLVNVKTMRTTAQIFLAFSEKRNCNVNWSNQKKIK